MSITRDMPAHVAASNISRAVSSRITLLLTPRGPFNGTSILFNSICRNRPDFSILKAGVDSIWNAM